MIATTADKNTGFCSERQDNIPNEEKKQQKPVE